MRMRLYRKCYCFCFILICFISASAKEKDYILLLNSINKDEAWVKNFNNELEYRINDQQKLDFKSFILSVPSLNTLEEVKEVQQEVLKTYPIPPKAVVIVGDPGWLVSAPLFDGPWKNIPVILCYSRERVPANLQILLDKVPQTLKNSIPITEFNKNYNITVLRHPYFIPQTLQLIKDLLPTINRIAFISDNRYISIVTRQALQDIIIRDFPNLKLELLSSNILNTEQLLDTLGSYDKNTGVIYYSWFRQYSNAGSYLSDHLLKVIPNFLESPIFTLTDLNLKDNLFAGGYYISISDFTNTVISVIDKVLSGELASSIPYQDGGTPQKYLNYADLKWLNIPENLYPSDAYYYHKPPTFYEANKTYIWLIAFFLFLLLSVYTFYYFRSVKHNKELVHAKEKAEESDRLKSAFLANMSHEIRTPLNAIVGFSSILANSVDTEESSEYIEIIENNNSLLLQLINDIIDISKIESGSLEFNYSNVDINRCLQELINVFQLRTPQKVRLINAPALRHCTIYTEQNRLIQVLGNYISNSIKYTTKGSITIGYYLPKNERIRFFVRDTGTGIPLHQLDKIFERFVKLDSFKQGTGLGLSICKMIADKMNATVGAVSEVNNGSEFWFEIPYLTINTTQKP